MNLKIQSKEELKLIRQGLQIVLASYKSGATWDPAAFGEDSKTHMKRYRRVNKQCEKTVPIIENLIKNLKQVDKSTFLCYK